MVKFVIMSAARSGTSLLSTSLNAHSRVICHGEIFHKTNPEMHIRDEWRSRYNLQDFKGNPLALARSVLDDSILDNYCTAVGFKKWKFQNAEVCDTLLEDSAIFRIILNRDNRLAQFSSRMLAKETGVWNVGAKAKISREAPKLCFDRARFLKFKENHDELFRIYKFKTSGPVCEIHHSDLKKEGVPNDVLEFLDLKIEGLPILKKQLHSSHIFSRFHHNDHEIIEEVLDELGRSEWSTE